MRGLLQALQPPGQEATELAMRPLLLSGVLSQNGEALGDHVPLRQGGAQPAAGQPARELPGAERAAHAFADHPVEPPTKQCDHGRSAADLLLDSLLQEDQVLLQERPGDVLLQVHLEAHEPEARRSELLAQDRFHEAHGPGASPRSGAN